MGADDRFCPACGNSLANQSGQLPAGQLPVDFVTCLDCGTRHEPYINFCSSCGTSLEAAREKVRLERMHSMQPANSSFSLQAIKQVTATTSSFSSKSSTAVLTATPDPQPEADASPPTKAPYPVNTNSKLALITLFVSFFALSIWWLIELEHGHSPSTANELFLAAKANLNGGHLDKAIEQFGKLAMVNDSAFTSEQQQAFDEALSKRAQLSSGKKNWQAALFDLLRVSPAFANYEQCRKEIKNILAYQAAPLPVIEKSETAIKAPVETPAAAVSVKPVQIQPVAQASVTAVKETLPPNQYNARPPQPLNHAKPQGSIVITTVGGKYDDNDVARYHKMLADFFSPEHQASSSDPPTFKEWLDKGKPEF